MTETTKPLDKEKGRARTTTEKARRRTYKGITTGVVLICAGSVLLLNTSGQLAWGVWFDLLSWWPVLLIAWGLRLIFQNTPLHAVGLLGPALIVTTTILVASSYSGHASTGWTDLSNADATAIDCPPPPAGESATLRLQYAAGSVHVASEPSTAPGIKGSLRYDGPVPRRSCSSSGDLRLSRRGDWDDFNILVPFGRTYSAWETKLASSAPVDLHIQAAAAQIDADLRAFTLDHVEVSSAASQITLKLPPPTRRTGVTIEGAAMTVAITLPRAACFTLFRKRLLSSIDVEPAVMEDDRFPRTVTADACRSLPPDAPRYEIRVTAPVSTVTVEEG
jgi:hypothetical protein